MQPPRLTPDYADQLTYPTPGDYCLYCFDNPEREAAIGDEINGLIRGTIRDIAAGRYDSMEAVGVGLYEKLKALDAKYDEGILDSEPMRTITEFFVKHVHPDCACEIYAPGCPADPPPRKPSSTPGGFTP